jgi:hypothetical protein
MNWPSMPELKCAGCSSADFVVHRGHVEKVESKEIDRGLFPPFITLVCKQCGQERFLGAVGPQERGN